MAISVPIVVDILPVNARARPVEMCEHKGIGHPDSICDGVAEAVSHALCEAYIKAYGTVKHHNVDKALLAGGQSAPRFGGGRLITPLRLIVCGRASALPDIDMADIVCNAARAYLAKVLRCSIDIFVIESLVRASSPNLQRVIGEGNAHAVANDTSFGTGFAPLSELERAVLRFADVLGSQKFRTAFPVAGDDFKVMGSRVGIELKFTVALAMVDRHVFHVSQYFATKADVVAYLKQTIHLDCAIELNALDSTEARDEAGLYLTVTGLSAEHGDDGQVGRGNRVNGLITPNRSMSLEAAAGKNPVAHVGKIYNVQARVLAQAIVDRIEDVSEVTVQLLSTIGRPIDQPALVYIQATSPCGANAALTQQIVEIAREQLGQVEALVSRLVHGDIRVF